MPEEEEVAPPPAPKDKARPRPCWRTIPHRRTMSPATAFLAPPSQRTGTAPPRVGRGGRPQPSLPRPLSGRGRRRRAPSRVGRGGRPQPSSPRPLNGPCLPLPAHVSWPSPFSAVPILRCPRSRSFPSPSPAVLECRPRSRAPPPTAVPAHGRPRPRPSSPTADLVRSRTRPRPSPPSSVPVTDLPRPPRSVPGRPVPVNDRPWSPRPQPPRPRPPRPRPPRPVPGGPVPSPAILAHGRSRPRTWPSPAAPSPAAPSPSSFTSAPADGRFGVPGSQTMVNGWRWSGERDCDGARCARWPEWLCVAVQRHDTLFNPCYFF